MPTVSVIMPAYNASGTLGLAATSVIDQSESSWELCLILDVNTDELTKIEAQRLASSDSRIRLISGPTQGGCVANRNEGLLQAQGEFVAFLDSDDWWSPEKLSIQLAAMRHEQAILSCTGYQLALPTGQLLPTRVTPPKRVTYDALLSENVMGCLTVMFRREAFPGVAFLDHLHEDYILWLQMLRQTPALGIQETLAYYRVSPSSRSGNKLRAAAAKWRILRRFEKLPLALSLWVFVQYIWKALNKHRQLIPS